MTTLPTLGQPVGVFNIVIPQAADFRMDLLVISRDENGDPEVIDTAGWNIRLQVRAEPDLTTTALLTASVANGYITRGIEGTGSNQTNIRIKVPASVTIALADWGVGGYDLDVIYPNLDRDIILTGTACLKNAYTDPYLL